MDGCCRVCSRKDSFRPFSLYAVAETTQEVIANMILDISNIQVTTEDGLPQQICPDCLIALSLAYSFRKQCHHADAKFRNENGKLSSLQTAEKQNQPSPTLNEGSFAIIKEEVDLNDYDEYSNPSSHGSQWVTQNPHPIGEGPMTVVHNIGEHFYNEANNERFASNANDNDGNSMLQPMDMGKWADLEQNDVQNKVPDPNSFGQSFKRQKLSGTGEQEQPNETEPTKTWNTHQMNDALKLIKDGMSFYKASNTFKIPIATLYWTAQRQGIKSQQPEFNKSYKEHHMTTALEAIKAGLSVTKASLQFNISPSTLRRHIGQHGIKIQSPEPTWTEEQMQEALALIRGGMNWKSAATKYNIPYATLMKRGKRCGLSCPEPKHASQEQLNEALKAVQEGMSFRKAEAVFNIPHGTIYHHAKVNGINRSKDTIRSLKNGYTKEQMDCALKAVENGMSYAKAALAFNVPPSTICVNAKRKASSSSASSNVSQEQTADGSSQQPSPVRVKLEIENDE